jgi:hypothetical protein
MTFRRAAPLAALLALAISAARPVRADMVAPAPPQLDVLGVDTTHTAAGPPTSAVWELYNRERAPVEVRVVRAVCLLPTMRLPLAITGVRIDGREGARDFTIAPGARARVEVALADFSGPSSAGRDWRIELALQVSGGSRDHGGYASGVTTIRRASAGR